MLELVYRQVSKTCGACSMWVRVPPRPHNIVGSSVESSDETRDEIHLIEPHPRHKKSHLQGGFSVRLG